MGRGRSVGNSQVEPLNCEGGGGQEEEGKERISALELSSKTAAWRRNLTQGPETNVSVLWKPGYCSKRSVGPLTAPHSLWLSLLFSRGEVLPLCSISHCVSAQCNI